MTQWASYYLPQVCQIARQAGEAILEIYQKDDMGITYKSDQSPVTHADLIAHQIIHKGLTSLKLGVTIVSEEEDADIETIRQKASLIWLVDPLDGTKEFIAKTGEFTVNIGLVDNGKPILGVVYVPVRDEMYFASIDTGAFYQKNQQTPIRIQVAPVLDGRWRITMSRRHSRSRIQEMLNGVSDYEIISCGSALKLCLIAKGEADIYPRLGPTSEWDTAAGDCILKAAGGEVIDFNGKALEYNKKSTLLNCPFIALSSLKFLDYLSLQRLQGLVVP